MLFKHTLYYQGCCKHIKQMAIWHAGLLVSHVTPLSVLEGTHRVLSHGALLAMYIFQLTSPQLLSPSYWHRKLYNQHAAWCKECA